VARKTAQIAEPISGDQLYQERARLALPILVRQAESGRPISYSDLAEELGMPNPRNLNYPLGSIGQTLINISKSWKAEIPPIQSLVVSKSTGLPGEGVAWFVRDWGDFASLSRIRQRELVIGAHALIYAYPRWAEILKLLDLAPVKSDFSVLVERVSENSNAMGGGESERHRALKEFVASNPTIVGLPKKTPKGNIEVGLPSGDSLDVSFNLGDDWIAVEIKTSLSDITDVVRGLYQCIKYRAVMEAVQAAAGTARSSRAILVLEGQLAQNLVPLRNLLGVEVCENINSLT